MKSSYLTDILDQPEALQHTLEGLDICAPLATITKNLADGKYRRIVLTGMGSSYHALYPLYLRLIEQGFCVYKFETSELIHYSPSLVDPTTLIVVVSQSGQSAEVVHLLDMLGQEVPVIGVTNTPDSPLAQKASAVVLTHAGQEFSVSCKTYLSALAAICWLGDELISKNAEAHYPSLESSPQKVAQYLEGWRGYADYLKELLEPIHQLFLVGRGTSLAAVNTGALIIKEAARFPTEGMSSASFRHGPLEMISPKVLVLVYLGSKKTATLNSQLFMDVSAAGGKAVAVKDTPTTGLFNLHISSEPIRPILEILPAQMVSLALAEIQGHEPGRFERISKITTQE